MKYIHSVKAWIIMVVTTGVYATGCGAQLPLKFKAIITHNLVDIDMTDPFVDEIMSPWCSKKTKAAVRMLAGLGVAGLGVLRVNVGMLVTGAALVCQGGHSVSYYAEQESEPHYNKNLPLTDPVQALHVSKCVLQSAYMQELIDCQKHNELFDYKKFARTYKKKCPYFLINDDEKFFDPHMQRSLWEQYPQSHDNFTTIVASDVVAAIDWVRHRPVETVSIHQSGLFMELMVLAKALRDRPHGNMVLNLVGNHYMFVRAAGSNEEYDGDMNVRAHTLVDNYPTWKHRSESDAKQFLMHYDSLHSARTAQLLRWLGSQYPDATVNVRMHGSVQKYLEYQQNYNVPVSDVLFARMGESYCYDNTQEDFDTLYLHALQKNVEAKNVILARRSQGMPRYATRRWVQTVEQSSVWP